MSDEEDFAAMFEASAKAAPLRTGQALEGTVVASIALDELRDDDGALEVAVGVCETVRARKPLPAPTSGRSPRSCGARWAGSRSRGIVSKAANRR